MQTTQTEDYFKNIQPVAYKDPWLCLSLLRSGVYRYGLMTPDIVRDTQRVWELMKQHDSTQATWILTRTLHRLSSRLEEVNH